MTPFWKRCAGLLLLTALPCVVAWRQLAATISLAWRDDEYTHILLILPVSIALIVQRWPHIRNSASTGSNLGSAILAASGAIAGSAMLWHVAPADQQLAICMLSVVTWWGGAFVLTMGNGASQASLFPLLFLFGMVPLPRAALDLVVGLLQQASAWFAGALFSLSGIPSIRDGVVLTIPGLTLMVSQECSSIRSSTMLLVVTLVLAHLLLQSYWRRACLIALVIPLSLAKNGLRIFIIAMLTTKVDPGYMTGNLHRQGGIIFFVAALVAIYLILQLFRRADRKLAVVAVRAPATPVRTQDLASS